MNKLPLLLATVLAGGFAASTIAQTSTHHATTSKNKVTTATVTMTQLNNSNETGVATLTALPNNQTRVSINVKGEFPTANQPAHIHEGTCANLNPAPKYPLNNVSHGRSVTVVPVSLSSLLKGQFAINMHKSAKEINQYVACGDITGANVSTTVTRHKGASGGMSDTSK